MLVKVLGALDLIGGLFLLLGTEISSLFILLLILGVVFLIKAGIGLLKDFASWIDLFGGAIFILLMFFHVPLIICIISGLLLIQKGIFSFF